VLPLAAYADRLSARPGETLEFKVANRTGAPVSARVVRVISADPNPAGPGIVLERLDMPVEKVCEPTAHDVPLGSYAEVDATRCLTGLADFTLVLTVLPTLIGRTEQCLVSWLTDHGRAGFALSLDTAGNLVATAGIGSATPVKALLGGPLTERQWVGLTVRHDTRAATLRTTVEDLTSGAVRETTTTLPSAIVSTRCSRLTFAGGAPAPAGRPFNGRLERPALYAGAVDTPSAADASSLRAAWDFSQQIENDRIVDVGPLGCHGRLINSPTRAVTGSNWSGREMSWRHAPEEYGAIHFHDDDIDDCRWPTAFRLTLPPDLRSAAYALVLSAGDVEENVPFFVVPPKGKRTADIAVLVSTFTYTVYANHARPEWMNDEAWRQAWLMQSAAWKAYPHNPGEHRDYALSTYNYHSDGSGVSLSSWHRPIQNLRIGYLTYPYPDIRASGLRHYPADSHLTAWLEAKGYSYDIITDWELHHEGHELLRSYPVLLTGTHPEYHTREMLDALTTYRDAGGRFCYLGGNGFYWKIALCDEKPGVVEIRRGEGGIRAWAADPGEYYNQFDGEYGGLWRRNGRPPQKLSGVGFTAQGNFVGSHYRFTPEADDPRVAWMRTGITSETIGGYGLSGHGAAGFELDRTDKRLGTPAHAIVVARSEDHPPEAPWVLVPEEQLTHITTIAGRPHRDLIHADLTFFETAGGKGAVFSTGSITFCGSLPHNGYDNDVSRLMKNVLDRFLDPRPFA